MGQEVEILTDVKYLVPGETVTVPIVVNLPKPMKVRRITGQFIAEERAEAQYTERSTDSKGKTTTTTKTAVSTNPIAKEEFTFVGEPPAGCLSGIGDFFASLVGAGKGVHMDAGRHEYTTQFTIPEDAPASMKGEKCSIYYNLSARVDRPLKLDYSAKHEFSVAPTVEKLHGDPVVAYYPDDDGRGFWDKTFGKDARLTLALQSDVYTPGDKIIALFQAETDSPIKIKAISARLICEESTRAKGHTDGHIHHSEPITVAAAQEIHGGFSSELILDAEAIGPQTMRARDFDVSWFVEVRMDVPWAKDPVIRAPIRMIGA